MEAYETRMNKKKSFKRKSVPVLAIVCIAAAMIGAAATLAYLASRTTAVVNSFTPGKIVPEIEESFDGKEKSSVVIANSLAGNVKAYIRVAVVANNLKLVPGSSEIAGDFFHEDVVWDDANKEWKKTGESHEIEDYLKSGSDGWIKYGDYYYYTAQVEPGGNTSELIAEKIPIYKEYKVTQEGGETTVTVIYNHQVTVLAEAIQADGVVEKDGKAVKAVVDAWGVDPEILE